MEHLRRAIKQYRPNWPLPTKLIGHGGGGNVYNTNNGRVMKVSVNNLSKEFNILKRLKTASYVPHVRNGNFVRLDGNFKVFGPWRPAAKSVFIMNKVGGANAMTFGQYKQKYGSSININTLNRRLTNALSNLQVRGILHGNINGAHGGNIIVTVTSSGKITGAWVIDFGTARHIAKNGYNPKDLYALRRLLGRKTRNTNELAAKLGTRRTEIAGNLRLLTNSTRRVGRSKSASPVRRPTVSPRPTKKRKLNA